MEKELETLRFSILEIIENSEPLDEIVFNPFFSSNFIEILFVKDFGGDSVGEN